MFKGEVSNPQAIAHLVLDLVMEWRDIKFSCGSRPEVRDIIVAPNCS